MISSQAILHHKYTVANEGGHFAQFVRRFPRPNDIAGKVLRLLSNVLQPEEVPLVCSPPKTPYFSQLIPPEERPRLINSVANYQSLTVRQGGIIEMQFTSGDTETSLFKIQQITRKKVKESYFTQVCTADNATRMIQRCCRWSKVLPDQKAMRSCG